MTFLLTLPHNSSWDMCHLTTTFVADALGALWAAGKPPKRLSVSEATSAVNFTLNELLENALKFHHEDSIEVSIEAGVDAVSCRVRHQILDEVAVELREHLQWLADNRPDALLQQRVKQQADGNKSGLGLLTILADYGARLSGQLESVSPNTLCLTMQAQLPI